MRRACACWPWAKIGASNRCYRTQWGHNQADPSGLLAITYLTHLTMRFLFSRFIGAT
jgi:hypothetical protein